jgi:hypothetical protein
MSNREIDKLKVIQNRTPANDYTLRYKDIFF